MRRLHIVGRKNHGKTTLVVELVGELTRRGMRVGTIKHTHHHHELDVPGKDSYRHRAAGAAVVGVLSRGLSAVFVPETEGSDRYDRYGRLAPAFGGCDLVLVEGDSQTDAAKLEVWRQEVGGQPISETDASILAVVSDDEVGGDRNILPRSDLSMIADWVLARFAPHSE